MRKTAYSSEKEQIVPFVLNQRPTAICQTCLRPIYNETVVQCTKCHGFVQCLNCFSVGAEKGKHLREHPFIIVESNFPEILSSGWGSKDELYLLQAIQTSGLGNWREIARDLNDRTPEECENHYFFTYFESKFAPKPENYIKEDPPAPEPWPEEDSKPVESFPSDGNEANMRAIGHTEKETPREFSGYMPKRGEFETEFCNEAENIVCGITFDTQQPSNASSTQQQMEEFEQKLNRLIAYNYIVEERDYRHDVICDYGILDGPFSGFLPSRTPQEQEAEQTLIPLSPFYSYMQLSDLTKMLQRKDQLQQYISKRNKWKALGITSEKQGQIFENLESVIKRNGEIDENQTQLWNSTIEQMIQCEEKQKSTTRLLNDCEIDICKNLKLNSSTYLELKDLLLREYAINGSLSIDSALNLAPPFSNEIKTIYTYFIKVGWLTN